MTYKQLALDIGCTRPTRKRNLFFLTFKCKIHDATLNVVNVVTYDKFDLNKKIKFDKID